MATSKGLGPEDFVTRNELRAMGFNYSSTQFGRWEKAQLLHAHKAGGLTSARVHYRWQDVQAFFSGRNQAPKSTDT
jgi:hypothetical protein